MNSFLTGGGGASCLVIRNLEFFRDGTEEDLLAWLNKHYPKRTINGRAISTALGMLLPEEVARQAWGSSRHMTSLHPFLIHRLDVASRLALTQLMESIDLYIHHPMAYIHILQTDDPLLQRVTRELKNAFGVGLVINWGGGRSVGFHVGPEPERTRAHVFRGRKCPLDNVAAVRGENNLPAQPLRSCRYTFCTWLSRQHPIQVVQRLMRHSTIKLTSDLYTDLGLEDLGAESWVLPPLEPAPPRTEAGPTPSNEDAADAGETGCAAPYRSPYRYPLQRQRRADRLAVSLSPAERTGLSYRTPAEP
jgi:hypothetical protein